MFRRYFDQMAKMQVKYVTQFCILASNLANLIKFNTSNFSALKLFLRFYGVWNLKLCQIQRGTSVDCYEPLMSLLYNLKIQMCLKKVFLCLQKCVKVIVFRRVPFKCQIFLEKLLALIIDQNIQLNMEITLNRIVYPE